jgi:hypothetical protein
MLYYFLRHHLRHLYVILCLPWRHQISYDYVSSNPNPLTVCYDAATTKSAIFLAAAEYAAGSAGGLVARDNIMLRARAKRFYIMPAAPSPHDGSSRVRLGLRSSAIHCWSTREYQLYFCPRAREQSPAVATALAPARISISIIISIKEQHQHPHQFYPHNPPSLIQPYASAGESWLLGHYHGY